MRTIFFVVLMLLGIVVSALSPLWLFQFARDSDTPPIRRRAEYWRVLSIGFDDTDGDGVPENTIDGYSHLWNYDGHPLSTDRYEQFFGTSWTYGSGEYPVGMWLYLEKAGHSLIDPDTMCEAVPSKRRTVK